MSTFSAASLQNTAPDPTRHVNYSQGMVLGVDDFIQEFAYLNGRGQWLARDLLGYGTLCGLQVFVKTDADGPVVHVTAGTAVNPRGQLIRVPLEQCANLKKWLAVKTNQQALAATSALPPAKLYVVLCYRACPTDDVPIPGEPCRSEEELSAPSRWTDDFKLELRTEPPDQCEEEAVRAFTKWLNAHLEIGEYASMPLDDFKNAIRNAAQPLSSPPCPSPEFAFESPPAMLVINTADANRYLRAAFLVWVTELRPRWRARLLPSEVGCSSAATGQETVNAWECVLLAELDFSATPEWEIAGSVTVNEDQRPYLLHLRMQQEWLLRKGVYQE